MLKTDAREAFLANGLDMCNAVVAGKTRKEVADTYGISYPELQRLMRPLGLPDHRGPRVDDPDRLKDVFSLRERGETYKDIGKKFGLTGERVRQLLKYSGRSDLLGYKVRHIDWSCSICGLERRVSPGKAHAHQACSQECGGRLLAIRTALKLESVERAIIIMDHRARGDSWGRATAMTDYAGSSNRAQAFYFLGLWAKAIDVDVGWAYDNPASSAPNGWRATVSHKVGIMLQRHGRAR